MYDRDMLIVCHITASLHMSWPCRRPPPAYLGRAEHRGTVKLAGRGPGRGAGRHPPAAAIAYRVDHRHPPGMPRLRIGDGLEQGAGLEQGDGLDVLW